MFSLTSQYALRALIYLARHADLQPISGRRIATDAGIPANYLSKVLNDLVRSGVLESSPGKTGGFRLRRPPEKIKLFEVVVPFEQFEDARCPFGNHVCSDDNPCAAHEQWKHVVIAQREFLHNTSVFDVAQEARKTPCPPKPKR